jgi:hypothetical protein
MASRTAPEPADVVGSDVALAGRRDRPADQDGLVPPDGRADQDRPADLRHDGRADHDGPMRRDGLAPPDGLAEQNRLVQPGGLADQDGLVPPGGLADQDGPAQQDGPVRRGWPAESGGGPGAGAGPDDALVEASGMPPEVAVFLADAATAAGVELGAALLAAGVRLRRRSRTSPDRVQRSFYLSRDLVDRARAAVSATMRLPGEAYNVSQLASRALENEVLRLERSYNGGERFPPVTHVPSGPSPEGVERIRAGVTTPRRRRDVR